MIKGARGTIDGKSNTLRVLLILHPLTFILCLILLLSGCGARRTPDLERIFAPTRERANKPPVIVVPGILGSQLVNRRTGEVVWPSAFRSSVDDLSLPVTPDLAANRDELIPTRIVETAKLARLAPEVYVYYNLLEALRRYGGYREGDWTNPPAEGDHDTFYVFPYDWRRDNVETARDLIRHIDELKRKLNRPDLRFNIIAHSMGGLAARYAAMYGDQDLPDEGAPLLPTWEGAQDINKIFMFGTPNEGAAEAFATLLDGYSVTEGLRPHFRLFNKLTREDILTCPAIYELLPHKHATMFLDENLAPLTVDLYDVATWKHYGWSAVNDQEYRARFARGEIKPPLAPSVERNTLAQLDAYFAAALQRARRFHEALDMSVPAELSPVPLFVFGGDCEETLSAPIIMRDARTERWITLTRPQKLRTASGREVSSGDVRRAMFEPGDGRVTRRSLLGESLTERRASSLFNTSLPIAYAVFACDLHSDLQSNKILQDNALTLLISEALK